MSQDREKGNDMRIIDYFKDDRQQHWLAQIRQYEWRAALFLAQLLMEGTFHEALGPGTLYLLTDGDALVSFLTLAQRDCIDDAALSPWIGFVHTAPAYRGHRYVGRLLDHAVRIAGVHGAKQVYICTDHIGLYEKYGFTYMENRISIYGEDSRVYLRRTEDQALRIERVTEAAFRADSLDGFIRHQAVRECWRCMAGEWRLVPNAFTEHWGVERLRAEAGELLRMIAAGKPVFAAFAGDEAVGFAALGERLGSCGQYIELRSCHVSEPWRGMGVGRRLFGAVCGAARQLGAEKLYISAHSSKESQAAYRALGCVHAQEPDPVRVAAEPFDVQLEFDLHKPLTFRFGKPEDLPQWMRLVRRVAWNFPGLETEEALAEHAVTVAKFIRKGNAICAAEGDCIAGVLLFSRRLNMLCCMAVAPEHRRRGAAQGMFDLMQTIADRSRELTVTTFREGDAKADAPRAFYRKQGFVPAELTIENGYPCQRFVRRVENEQG